MFIILLIAILMGCAKEEEPALNFERYESIQLDRSQLKIINTTNSKDIQLLVGDFANDTGSYFDPINIHYNYMKWVSGTMNVAVMDISLLLWADATESKLEKQEARYSSALLYLKAKYNKVYCLGHGVGGFELAYFESKKHMCDKLILSGTSLVPYKFQHRNRFNLPDDNTFWFDIDLYMELSYSNDISSYIEYYEKASTRIGSAERVRTFLSGLDTGLPTNSIIIPVLLMTGSDSKFVSPTVIEEHIKVLPKVTLYVQPNAGHNIFLHQTRLEGWQKIAAWIKETQ